MGQQMIRWSQVILLVSNTFDVKLGSIVGVEEFVTNNFNSKSSAATEETNEVAAKIDGNKDFNNIAIECV